MTGSRSPEDVPGISDLRKLEPEQRRKTVARATGLNTTEQRHLGGSDVLSDTTADAMIENVIGKFELPMGVASNFNINGKDYLIPMAVEEPSVVAAASYMAKLVRRDGGFKAATTPPVMRGQIQVLDIADLETAKQQLLAQRDTLITQANEKDKVLCDMGGGCEDIEVHLFSESAIGPMLVMHILVDVRDAMGANAVNSMAEHLAPLVEKITGGEVRLRILSNLADQRLATSEISVSPETLSTADYSGERVIQGIVEAYALAEIDPYRAATHNKGIMNGIDPVVVATGNDWRAIEAGAHAYAARSGRYSSLTTWHIEDAGNLIGKLQMPMALGIVGGATKTHPAAKTALKMMAIESASELAEVAVSVGLAQNMAALRALSTEGIQRGHMALHARNIAITAGAQGEAVADIAGALVREGNVSVDRALELLGQQQ